MILKSSLSSFSHVFRRVVEYNLGSLLAIGLFRSWKNPKISQRNDSKALFAWRELPSQQLYISFEIIKPLQREAGGRNTKTAGNGENKESPEEWMEMKYLLQAYSGPQPDPNVHSLRERFHCFLGSWSSTHRTLTSTKNPADVSLCLSFPRLIKGTSKYMILYAKRRLLSIKALWNTATETSQTCFHADRISQGWAL